MNGVFFLQGGPVAANAKNAFCSAAFAHSRSRARRFDIRMRGAVNLRPAQAPALAW